MKQSEATCFWKTLIVLQLSCLLAAPLAMGSELMVFPAKGQTAQQQQADQQECQQWAVTNSGVDPSSLSPPKSVQPQSGGRTALRGAAAGAAVGGLGGSMGGEFGKGAAVGAAVGGVAGAVKQRRQQAGTESVNRQNQQHYQQQIEKFNRAYGACLEGKGYTVK